MCLSPPHIGNEICLHLNQGYLNAEKRKMYDQRFEGEQVLCIDHSEIVTIVTQILATRSIRTGLHENL